MSPKTLATIFEHCLEQPASSQGQNSPALDEDDATVEGTRSPDSLTGRSADGEKAQSDEPPSKVLLVEDNPINLKVNILDYHGSPSDN